MKLVKFALTPPVIAISVALCAARAGIAEEVVERTFFVTAASSEWATTENWKDGVLPADDGSESVYFDMSGYSASAPLVLLGGNSIVRKVYGLRFGGSTSQTYGNGVNFRGSKSGAVDGKLEIGAGGLTTEGDGTLNAKGVLTGAPLNPQFYCHVTLTDSQIWQLNGLKNGHELVFGGNNNVTLSVGEDVVWTFKSGKFQNQINFNARKYDIRGKFRTNGIVAFDAPARFDCLGTAGVTLYNYDYHEYESSPKLSILRFPMTEGADAKFSAPVTLDLTGTKPFFIELYKPSNQEAAQSHPIFWTMALNNTWSGSFTDCALHFVGTEAGYMCASKIYPDRQKYIFGGDNSGLVNDGSHIWIEDLLFTVTSPTAFGTGNAIPLVFGYYGPDGGRSAGNYGLLPSSVAGILAAPGITISSDISITNTINSASAAQQNSRHLCMFGAAESDSTVTFCGDFHDNTLDYSPNFSGTKAVKETEDHPLWFYAPNGAVVNVTGDISGFSRCRPVNVVGKGVVVFSGDNSGLATNLVVRGGTAVLASSTAGGASRIVVGDTVSVVKTVKYYSRRLPNNEIKNAKTTLTKATATSEAMLSAVITPWVVDGATLEVGDTVLVNDSSTGLAPEKNGIYELRDDNKLHDIWTTDDCVEGARILVTDGNDFAGSVWRVVGSVKANYRYQISCTDDYAAQPDVKVLAKGGVTIANAIDVTDNKSTGVSAIGAADASAVTFSGAITLAKDVIFEAPAGATVNMTGAISNEGGFNVGFAGLGTTVFASPLDITGRAITVTLPVDGVPTEGSVKYVLATGLSGTPASVTVLTDDGSAVPAEWSVRVVGSKLVFRNKPSGFGVIVR